MLHTFDGAAPAGSIVPVFAVVLAAADCTVVLTPPIASIVSEFFVVPGFLFHLVFYI